MNSAALDVYVAAFRARCLAMRRPGQAMVKGPGIHGLLPRPVDRHARLLVTDDRAHAVLPALVSDARAGMITVCAAAPRRLAEDSPGDVPLIQAVAAARLADPRITHPDALADHLRTLPPAFRLFVAVDHGGVVRATSGSGAFGTTASVIFVNTDPDWRRRGIARAMTATALRSAREAGARDAGLDASDAGRELYLRLGFEAATPTTRFRPSG